MELDGTVKHLSETAKLAQEQNQENFNLMIEKIKKLSWGSFSQETYKSNAETLETLKLDGFHGENGLD